MESCHHFFIIEKTEITWFLNPQITSFSKSNKSIWIQKVELQIYEYYNL